MSNISEVANNVVQEAIAKALKDLPQKVYAEVMNVAAVSLGFSRNHWNKEWEVGCSNGNNQIRNLISSEARDSATEALADIFKSDGVKDIIAKSTAAIIKNFKDQFNRHLRSAITARAEEAADAVACKIVDNIVVFDPVSLEIDIRDPKSYDTLLGEVLTELAVKRQCNKESQDE